VQDVGEVAPVRVQDAGSKIPAWELVKLTVPVDGVELVEASVMVAVQVVEDPQWTGLGLHEIDVVVGSNVTAVTETSNVPLLVS